RTAPGRTTTRAATLPPIRLEHAFYEAATPGAQTRAPAAVADHWVLMGRVTVANYDGDRQLASAKIARLAPGPAGAIVQVSAGDDLKRGIPGNSISASIFRPSWSLRANGRPSSSNAAPTTVKRAGLRSRR